jgi:hypothetical protein
VTADGVQIESAKPLVQRDPDDPKVLCVTINNDHESRKLLKQFSDPLKFALQAETPGNPGRTCESSFNLDLNKMVGLTALKMAVAAATLAFPDEVPRFADARRDLADKDENSRARSVVFDHRVQRSLDASRNPLCHTIYLEEQEGTRHGVVQFFDSAQASIALAGTAVPRSETSFVAASRQPRSERF